MVVHMDRGGVDTAEHRDGEVAVAIVHLQTQARWITEHEQKVSRVMV